MPLSEGVISQEEALSRAWAPLQNFMLNQVRSEDMILFGELHQGDPNTWETREDIPASVLIPAFILSELTMGFIIGFIMFLPFIVVDLVVASVLMAMGMMMLPPAMISLPFKILLFILSGGWNFVLRYTLATFEFY
jgi:flagellar biosynthetic protein FliP